MCFITFIIVLFVSIFFFFFFFNDTATTEIYTLSLHDALPISTRTSLAPVSRMALSKALRPPTMMTSFFSPVVSGRSEEHTSELQSRRDLVCRLLLEKKKKTNKTNSEYLYQITLPLTA